MKIKYSMKMWKFMREKLRTICLMVKERPPSRMESFTKGSLGQENFMEKENTNGMKILFTLVNFIRI